MKNLINTVVIFTLLSINIAAQPTSNLKVKVLTSEYNVNRNAGTDINSKSVFFTDGDNNWTYLNGSKLMNIDKLLLSKYDGFKAEITTFFLVEDYTYAFTVVYHGGYQYILAEKFDMGNGSLSGDVILMNKQRYKGAPNLKIDQYKLHITPDGKNIGLIVEAGNKTDWKLSLTKYIFFNSSLKVLYERSFNRFERKGTGLKLTGFDMLHSTIDNDGTVYIYGALSKPMNGLSAGYKILKFAKDGKNDKKMNIDLNTSHTLKRMGIMDIQINKSERGIERLCVLYYDMPGGPRNYNVGISTGEFVDKGTLKLELSKNITPTDYKKRELLRTYYVDGVHVVALCTYKITRYDEVTHYILERIKLNGYDSSGTHLWTKEIKKAYSPMTRKPETPFLAFESNGNLVIVDEFSKREFRSTAVNVKSGKSSVKRIPKQKEAGLYPHLASKVKIFKGSALLIGMKSKKIIKFTIE